jgi:DNA-binding NtrC family response regulator
LNGRTAASRLFSLAASPWVKVDELVEAVLSLAVAEAGADAAGLAIFAAEDHTPLAWALAGEGPPRPLADREVVGWRRGYQALVDRAPRRGVFTDRNLARFEASGGVLAVPLFAAEPRNGLLQVEGAASAARGLNVHWVGSSPKLLDLERQIRLIAADPKSPVLIRGERGSGKELAAYALHYHGRRRDRPFLPVNSAAFTDTLAADELFGHEKHAFTGAQTARRGIFRAADQGTLFFDEIADLPPPIQATLLRVLDRGELRTLGSDEPSKVDVRILGATNKDLQEAVRRGEFRADLYDRLNVFTLWVPALRDRRDDIELLATHFLRLACAETARSTRRRDATVCERCLERVTVGCIAPGFFDRLAEHDYPGNVRELRNVVARMAAMVVDDEIAAHHLHALGGGAASAAPGGGSLRLDAVIRDHIAAVLQQTGANKSQAARLLGIPLSTLAHKMRKLGLGA